MRSAIPTEPPSRVGPDGSGRLSEERTRSVLGALNTIRVVELVQDICRIPSVLGEEGAVAAFLADTMKTSGFGSVSLQPVLKGRPNALGELSFGPGPRVVLTGHMDTKPLSQGWTVCEPFAGAIVDGRVYGHGIMDMKAALICELVAIEAVRDSGIDLAGTAAFAAVSDHMGDQSGSIAYFDAHGADLCLLGELTDSEITLGHRGRLYFDIEMLGRSAHTCHKREAVNANVLAAQAILALDESALKPELEDWVVELFGPETVIVPGRVYGGLPPGGPSMIPDTAVIRVDCRTQPGVSDDTVRREIERCLTIAQSRDRRVQWRMELVDAKSGYLVDRDAPVVSHARRAVRTVRGVEPILKVEGWLGDTASFGDRIPTVLFGPGGNPVYAADEYLSIEDITEATQVYALFVADALDPSLH